jgi:hypothetical protein
MDKGSSEDEASLSLKRFRGGAQGGAPSLGTLEDRFGRSPNAGISLCRGSFAARGTGMGGYRIPGTSMEE